MHRFNENNFILSDALFDYFQSLFHQARAIQIQYKHPPIILPEVTYHNTTINPFSLYASFQHVTQIELSHHFCQIFHAYFGFFICLISQILHQLFNQFQYGWL